jgi:hypothetical protein
MTNLIIVCLTNLIINTNLLAQPYIETNKETSGWYLQNVMDKEKKNNKEK